MEKKTNFTMHPPFFFSTSRPPSITLPSQSPARCRDTSPPVRALAVPYPGLLPPGKGAWMWVCGDGGESVLATTRPAPPIHPHSPIPPSNRAQVFFLTPDAADDTPLFWNKAIDREQGEQREREMCACACLAHTHTFPPIHPHSLSLSLSLLFFSLLAGRLNAEARAAFLEDMVTAGQVRKRMWALPLRPRPSLHTHARPSPHLIFFLLLSLPLHPGTLVGRRQGPGPGPVAPAGVLGGRHCGLGPGGGHGGPGGHGGRAGRGGGAGHR